MFSNSCQLYKISSINKSTEAESRLVVVRVGAGRDALLGMAFLLGDDENVPEPDCSDITQLHACSKCHLSAPLKMVSVVKKKGGGSGEETELCLMGTDTTEIKINSENDEAPTRSKLHHNGNLVRDNSTRPPCFSSNPCLTSALCPHHIPLPSFISYLQVRQNFRTFELLLANKAFPKLSCHLTPFSIAAPGEHPAPPLQASQPSNAAGAPAAQLELRTSEFQRYNKDAHVFNRNRTQGEEDHRVCAALHGDGGKARPHRHPVSTRSVGSPREVLGVP